MCMCGFSGISLDVVQSQPNGNHPHINHCHTGRVHFALLQCRKYLDMEPGLGIIVGHFVTSKQASASA